ncbi:hypothetical protein HDC92_001812 [Pedobacter sp. AK017]|uniref:RagB/SusD family nutrient uptake outer membrane protein n=1 Tax=Pedobacter sp. AK017 TaxID=2723073 RepID=UPI0016224B6D|nr:RagB/SusD family nutrient uptake outer membrane protein [Pedobacter sp. AK017]MBB5438137.1 hypothetical protein [Pedobacter sp. AK017]
MKIKIISIITFAAISSLLSCKKFIANDPPKNSLVPASVFQNPDLATAALLGIYQQMATSGFSSNDASSISTVCGLTADEFIGHSPVLQIAYQNLIIPENQTITGIWTGIYTRLYDANALLEGLNSANAIATPIKSQLQGEAYFIRAFCYYYLVNLYGDVPLILTANYKANSSSPKIPADKIYTQILADLQMAANLLGENYPKNERVRANKAATQALLARVYLYLGDWENAEKYSTLVINRSSTYKLLALDAIFLKSSQESIWQLMPNPNANSPASFLIIPGTAAPSQASLRSDFATQAFETGDQRKTAWVKSMMANGVTYYYPYKYRAVIAANTPVTEYTMVLRLAEQVLIRAEARARQNKLSDAIDDLDLIRNRATLPLIKNTSPGISQNDLLDAITRERRVELFGEWGDRWFTLKRTNKLNATLTGLKPNWKSNYVLFPIPFAELKNNTSIKQNEGY